MKKSFAYLVAVLLLILSLAGCADDGRDNTNMVSPVPTAMPSASPYVSPDVDDGIVKDNDGIIGDNDTGSTNDNRVGTGSNGTTGNGTAGTGTAVSPSPSANTETGK